MAASESTTKLCRLYGRFDDFLFTKSAGVLGGIELSGIDPRGLSARDFSLYSTLARNIQQSGHKDAVITQYYMHFSGVKVHLKKRQHARSAVLSARRERFLNKHRMLSGARLFHFMELPPERDINTMLSIDSLLNLAGYFTDKKARELVKARFSDRHAILAYERDVEERCEKLGAALKERMDKFGVVATQSHAMTINELWAAMRALFNLNPSYLDEALYEPVPVERWDALLFDGDVEQILINGKDTLKVNGPEPVYARVASVVGVGEEYVPEGLWANGNRPPVLQSGNYMIMSRFRPMSNLKRALMFNSKSSELERRSFSLMAAFKGNETMSEVDKQAVMKESTKKLLQELDEVQNLPDGFGHFSSQIAVFDTDPERLTKQCKEMNTALSQAGAHIVWETAGHLPAFENFLPGRTSAYTRDIEFTTSQFGACSLLYKSSEGQKTWGEDSDPQEAQYVFESDDGVPFYFSPYIGGRCVVIGIGPIRSGKSFTKNTLGSHFMKYGGFLSAIDIDPGSEPVAEFFGDEGGIFRIEEGADRGFNPFYAATGPRDSLFKAHLTSQLKLMMLANDTPDMRSLDADEQIEVDKAIGAVLELPKHMQTLTALTNHCSKAVAKKLARFCKGGLYGNLFDNEIDAMGSITTRIQAYNLAGVKDNAVTKPLVMNEVFYRVTRLFEDPALRHLPKFLDIDEAHDLLKIPQARERVVGSVRTWGKWNGGIGLWSQSPKEYLDVPDWPAIRSAATTFFFMADSELEVALYKKAFPQLKDGHLEAIANLTPKKQAFIWQPEIGVAKTVNLLVEPEQYVINTSKPNEASLRRKSFQEMTDIDAAIQKVVRDLNLEIAYQE